MILIRVVPVTILALLLTIFLARYAVHRALEVEVKDRLDRTTLIDADMLGRRLERIRESAANLAEHDLVIDAATGQPRQVGQLNAVLAALRLASPAFRHATMTDSQGRVIASSNPAWRATGKTLPSERLVPEVIAERNYFGINRQRILVAAPVNDAPSPQAIVVIEYDTGAFLSELQSLGLGERVRLFNAADLIYDSATSNPSITNGPSRKDASSNENEHTQSRDAEDQWNLTAVPVPGFPDLKIERSEEPQFALAVISGLDWCLVGTLAACIASLLYAIYALARLFTRAPGNLSRDTVSLERLRASESRMRTVVESVPNGILGINNDGKITLVNAKLEEMFGHSREDLLGQPLEILIPHSHRPAHQANREAYKQNPEPRSMAERRELFGLHHSGSAIPVEIGLTPIDQSDALGTDVSVLASVVNVSERRRHEEEKERLRKQAQLILNSIPAMVMFKDTNNRLLQVNVAAAKMMGKESPAEIENRHSSEFFAEHEKYFADDLLVMESKQPRLGIIESFVAADGSLHWASTDKIPVFGGTGEGDSNEVVGIIAVINDITPLKTAEEALLRANTELRRSNEELAQFAYVASHDLQEPLRKVVSYCELLDEECADQLGEEGKTFMAYVVDGATRMRTLIQDLLAYSQIDSKAKPAQWVDANQIAQQAVKNLSAAIEESDAVVTIGNLPTVKADPLQLSQLFQNLIGNSIKYRREERPTVDITAKIDDANWTFLVSDNGIGIEPKYTEQIFGVFKRLHSMDDYQGTGIGLAICKRIIERIGGKIWVESTPGEGSTFFASIPR